MVRQTSVLSHITGSLTSTQYFHACGGGGCIYKLEIPFSAIIGVICYGYSVWMHHYACIFQ